MQTNNHDVAGLIRRLDRFQQELHKSVSSGTSKINEFDLERVGSYLHSSSAYIDWVQGQPALDLPESHPMAYDVPEPAVYALVENESVNDLMRLFSLLRMELLNSQSSRDAAGFNKFDERRARSVVTKAKDFLESYVSQVDPLDLPESSPSRAQSGPGKTGL